MYKFLFFCFVTLFFSVNDAQASVETIKIYSNSSDWSIQTSPYPGSWSTQYFSTLGLINLNPVHFSSAFLGAYNSNQGYLGIHRSFISFDTSILPDYSSVISASLHVTPNVVLDGYNDQYSYMNVLQGFQASATALTSDDIEKCGDVLENPTKGATDIDNSSITIESDLPFVLNETGKNWISKTGYTKLCLRDGHDIENKETVNNGNYWRESGITHYTSEATGTSTDPYLEITYEVPDMPPVDEKDMYDLIRELISAVEGYEFSNEMENSYFANLKKVEKFFNSAMYIPAENQLRAFLKKLKQDYKTGKITEEEYTDLMNRTNALLDILLDDAFGMVPLMTQIASPYPSLPETTEWATTTYADGRADKVGDCGRSIAQCGCAITSLSMIGKYHGITTGFDGSSVNPLHMNAWLLDNKGYSPDGSVLWNYALAYLGEEKDGKVMSRLSLDGHNETDTNTIGEFVDNANPSLGFNKKEGHYVVLTHTIDEGGFSVKDPLWYNTKTTDDERDVAGKVQDYNDVVSKANLIGYNPALTPLPESVEIVLESPAELLVTDERGRRLGYDVETNTFVSEIPGGSYDREDFILNPENPSANPHKKKRVYIRKPEGEKFAVEVIGTGVGEYQLSFAVTDGKGGLFGEQIASTTSVGKVDGYTVTTLAGTDALPSYLQDILKLIPQSEQKKFIQKFFVIAGQIEKNHVVSTEQIVSGLIRFIEEKYSGKVWSGAVIQALEELIA